ncbi:hypothetical protein [Streptomyces europaeiscabiei]|uniref:hypothetical protein n=1 Tax=Streptomyces europaeiscabiei TaxID=146819 RepID=UPI002E11E5E2|nr:hypothetical protein OHB30_45870 [Streptomyces europaeiscabiei]
MIDAEGHARGALPPTTTPTRAIGRHLPLRPASLPDEVLNAVVLLTSDETSHITGASLVADGDWSTVLPGSPLCPPTDLRLKGPARRARARRTPRASWPSSEPVWERPALTVYQVNDDQG